MADTLRLFVGINVGDAWTEALSDTAGRLASSLDGKGRRVRPELYHVTVVFLGNQPADAVTEICVTLAPKLAASQPVGYRSHPARLPAPVTMQLEHVLVCDGYLFVKYRR